MNFQTEMQILNTDVLRCDKTYRLRCLRHVYKVGMEIGTRKVIDVRPADRGLRTSRETLAK